MQESFEAEVLKERFHLFIFCPMLMSCRRCYLSLRCGCRCRFLCWWSIFCFILHQFDITKQLCSFFSRALIAVFLLLSNHLQTVSISSLSFSLFPHQVWIPVTQIFRHMHAHLCFVRSSVCTYTCIYFGSLLYKDPGC